MQKKALVLLLFVFSVGVLPKLSAQSGNIHFAHFVDTETTVFKDLNNRLTMQFTISNVADQADLDNIQYKFDHYGVFENIQFSVTPDLGVYAVSTISKPGLRVIDHRKLFMSCGIFTIFIEDQPYPTENFTVKMFNSN